MVKRSVTVLALFVCALGFLGVDALAAYAADPPRQNLEQAISDRAQQTTIAFSGLAIITGNLNAQSFFPPGKLADYWGFQYLRDNDPDGMGHNTSFLTRVACNVLYDLDAAQVADLTALAKAQVAQINQYGYKRYPLMQAFRRLVDRTTPSGATGLDLSAVKAASRELYQLDGRISFDRAVVFARVLRGMTATQKAYLDAMVGKGWASWPDKDMEDVRDKMAGLSHDESVAVMTYAGDLFSWYAGNATSDVYFCPERHGTYYGGFYIKDAPAMGRPGYSIDEQLTATAGSALCDSTQGYVTAQQAGLMTALVNGQRNNLYAGAQNMVKARTDISTALRSLMSASAPTESFLAAVSAQVQASSTIYGELDGENNYNYATTFAALAKSLSAAQLAKLNELRHSILSGTYSDGTPFDFTTCTTPYLFSAAITDPSVLTPYIANTDYLFSVTPVLDAAFSYTPAKPVAGRAVSFTDTSTGTPTRWSWSFGDKGTSTARNPRHTYLRPGTYTVTLTVKNATGTDTATSVVTVAAASKIKTVAPTSSPLGLQVKGAGFAPDSTVLLNGTAGTTVYRSSGLLLARGSSLVSILRRDISHRVVVRYPDGGRSAPFVLSW